MKQALVALAIAIGMNNANAEQINEVAAWATAISSNTANDRKIVFRYAKEFHAEFRRSNLPDRIILVWRYESESGMPATAEREAMDRLEDLLAPVVEKTQLALLAIVSTGEGTREWIYYTKSEELFLEALNSALADQQRFPLEIHAAPDPEWSTYTRFIEGVRE